MSTENDMSDHAFYKWSGSIGVQPFSNSVNLMRDTAREWRRRAEALLETKDREIGMLRALIRTQQKEIETERRKAFEAGFLARLVKNWNSEEAYHAYQEQNK